MRMVSVAALVLATSALVAPAAASIVVLGSTSGRMCYEAARDERKSDAALAQCNKALRADDLGFSEEVATYVNRGVVKLYRSEFDAAIADFDRAIALDPDLAESYLNKGSALLRKQASPAVAIPLFSEAIEKGTERPELAYFGRAIAHEISGDMKAAYLDYRRAQKAAPRWGLPREQLSRFQVRRISSPM